STDYVFDGRKTGPYREDDATNPINAYGRSKLAGDLAVAAAGGHHAILRVAWVYSATGRNFARTILRLAAERDRLTIVDDQFGSPTSVRLIAETTAAIIERHLHAGTKGFAAERPANGVYHLAPDGVTSWHRFAVELVREARRRGLPIRIED